MSSPPTVGARKRPTIVALEYQPIRSPRPSRKVSATAASATGPSIAVASPCADLSLDHVQDRTELLDDLHELDVERQVFPRQGMVRIQRHLRFRQLGHRHRNQFPLRLTQHQLQTNLQIQVWRNLISINL